MRHKISAWHLTAARARAANFRLSPVGFTIPAVEAGDGDLISLSGELKYITAPRVREKFLDRKATAPNTPWAAIRPEASKARHSPENSVDRATGDSVESAPTHRALVMYSCLS